MQPWESLLLPHYVPPLFTTFHSDNTGNFRSDSWLQLMIGTATLLDSEFLKYPVRTSWKTELFFIIDRINYIESIEWHNVYTSTGEYQIGCPHRDLNYTTRRRRGEKGGEERRGNVRLFWSLIFMELMIIFKFNFKIYMCFLIRWKGNFSDCQRSFSKKNSVKIEKMNALD